MHTQVDGRHWRQLYRAAVLNPQGSDLPGRIADAEKAIVCRTRELFRAGVRHIDERDELDEAFYMLRAWESSQAFR